MPRCFARAFAALALMTLFLGGCAAQPPAGALAGEQMMAADRAAATAPGTTAAATAPSPYILQAGDTLQVRLLYHPELNDRLPIQPDGHVVLQLIGEIPASGKTIKQLTEEVTSAYGRELKDAKVSISLAEFVKQRIYVGGQVRNPGAMTLQAPTTSLQAVIEAGGFSREAEPATVVVLRNQGTKTPLFIVCNLQKGLKTPGQNSDLILQGQDIVFVPMSKISELNQFVEQYVTKLIPAQLSLGAFYDFGKPH